jgi:hypothetical protein
MATISKSFERERERKVKKKEATNKKNYPSHFKKRK